MKKSLFIVLCLVFSVVSIKATSFVNRNSAVTYNNKYILDFNNYKAYIIYNKTSTAEIPFYFSTNSNIVSKYVNGGFLCLAEYKIAGSNLSYLFNPNGYWMMDESGEDSYIVINNDNGYGLINKNDISMVKDTQFIKKNTQVTGSGSYSNPWKFVKIPSSVSYNISSTINGAFPTETGNIDYGEDAKITISISSNYTFNNMTYSCGNTLSEKEISSDGRTLTLSFKEVVNNIVCTITPKLNVFTVYFNINNSNGGSVSPSTISVTNGKQYNTLPVASLNSQCQSFDGWYTSSSGGTQILSNTIVSLSNNQTLYAHWLSNTSGGTWGNCLPSYMSGSYASGTMYNSCGASQSCSVSCSYTGTYYDNGTCGNYYYNYNCGGYSFSTYAGYQECVVIPTCTVDIGNHYPTCGVAGDFEIEGYADTNITSCSWSGLKSGNNCGEAWGELCYMCDNAIIGVYPRGTWCNKNNTLTLNVCNSAGCGSCSNWYYPN